MSEIVEPHVLVASTMLDVSTDAVVREIARRGVRCTRINTETYPFETSLTMKLQGGPARDAASVIGVRRAADRELLAVAPTSIWFRRIRSPTRPAEMSPGVFEFCLRESRSTLLGIVTALPSRVMSPPSKVWAAEHKIAQLQAAIDCELTIPDTVVTNEAAAVRDAFRAFDRRMIAKPARSGFVDYGDEQHAVYTTQVLEEHLADLDGTRWSPVIYQRLVEKSCDVRATYVAGTFFVAEIDSQTDPAATIDWRRTNDPSLPHRLSQLPSGVENKARRLMQRLGLEFGALDFVRTPDGEYVFLEVNPNGQWLWLDDRLELGITAAIATWLGESSS